MPRRGQDDLPWGTRELYLVIVAHKGLSPMPNTWANLTSPAYQGKVALPDPAARRARPSPRSAISTPRRGSA